MSTIDALQVFVDKYGPTAPIKIMGDMNTKLPKNHDGLQPNWYKSKGFNKFSCIMNDFVVSNKLTVCDFNFKHGHGFTYFCETSGVYTWIDHVFSISYDSADILSCMVEPIDIDNVSDHVPITLSMLISMKRAINCGPHEMSRSITKRYLPPNWGSYEKIRKYQECLTSRLRGIDLLELLSGNDAGSRFLILVHVTINSVATQRCRGGNRRWCKVGGGR